MGEVATFVVVALVLLWIFRPGSGNMHLQERDQETEDLTREIMYRNPNMTYSEAYQQAVDRLNDRS